MNCISDIFNSLSSTVCSTQPVFKESLRELRFCIFARVSSPNQKNGYSLNYQIDRCKEWIKNNFPTSVIKDIDIVEICQSVRNKIPTTIKRKIDNNTHNYFVFYNVDRMSRSIQHGMELIKLMQNANIQWAVVEENITSDDYYNNPTSKERFIIKLIRAEEESDNISKRIRRSISLRKESNIPLRIPYGKKVIKDGEDIYLSDNKSELCVIEQIKRLYDKYKQKGYNKSLIAKKIATELNKLEYRYRYNKRFNEEIINNILKQLNYE